MKKLAIISTHPIQYNAPWFRLLTTRRKIQVKVFYTWSQSKQGSKYDPGFGRNIEWDIPLLDGYEYEFVFNSARKPGSRHFYGIQNPGLIGNICSWSPDAILIFGWNFNSHLKSIRYFSGKIPVLFRGDSTLLDNQKGIRSLLKKRILKWVYSKVDFALCVGTENRRYFLEYGLKEGQLIHVPHAIDNERFKPSDDKQKLACGLRAKFKIPQDAILFLFAGKLETKKDPLLLVKAFKKIGGQNCHLLIAGDGHLEKVLKQETCHNLNIHFLEFQNQQMMPVLYQTASVFVLPSKGPGETWGLAINEAMAAGKPVLVSDKCGGAGDLVEEDKNGYIFIAENLSDLCSKLDILLKKKSQLSIMGEFSFQKIQFFSFELICKRVEELIIKS